MLNLIAIQAVLNEGIQRGLQRQVEDIQKNTGTSVQIYGVKMLTPKVVAGSPISMNAGLTAKGNQSVHDVFSFYMAAFVDYHKGEDPKAEQSLRSMFEGTVVEQKKMVAEKKLHGQPLGTGNLVMFKTVDTPPISKTQVQGLLSGATRMYLLTWAAWKDVNGQDGTLSACQWLQPPSSLNIGKEELVWHSCAE